MDTKQTGKIKAIEHKAYEVYKEIDALVVQLQKEEVGWEEIEELKSARDKAKHKCTERVQKLHLPTE